ncbi:MAG: 30S ribosomal protein S5 [Nanoarchaeota archaeon]|nr:30S ribosomal protein S5 [Nanoarchaeota archaeon]
MAKDDNPQQRNVLKREFDKEGWKPRTDLGKKVKSGEIKELSEILDSGNKILEAEIVDALLPDLDVEMIEIGQSKGKFGGGKRSIWRQTQKKTKEGNKPKFATMIIMGNKNGYIGVGKGKGKETMPAREKAIRQSKLNVQKIVRGCGSWECGCAEPHTIPYKVTGKCGSVIVILIPAPKGVGLCVEEQCRKMLQFAGIKDVYSNTKGQTKSKINMMLACFDALKKLSRVKIAEKYIKLGGVQEGKLEDGKK